TAITTWDTRKELVAVLLKQGQETLSVLDDQIRLQTAVADQCKCPTCQQDLPPELVDPKALTKSVERRDAIRRSVDELKAEKATAEKAIAAAESALASAQAALNAREEQQTAWALKIAEQHQLVPEGFDAAVARAEFAQLSTKEPD